MWLTWKRERHILLSTLLLWRGKEGSECVCFSLAWRIPWTEEPGVGWGATVHGVAETDTTEATEHARTLFVVTESDLLIMQFQKSVSLMILFAFCINYWDSMVKCLTILVGFCLLLTVVLNDTLRTCHLSYTHLQLVYFAGELNSLSP